MSVLDRLGYRASLQVLGDLSRFNDSRARIQIGWINWIQDYPAPSDFITLTLSCRSFVPHDPLNLNNAEFCNPKIDTQMGHAARLQALAPGAATEAWRGIDQQITDQAPWLPLYNTRVDIATSPRVGTTNTTPSGHSSSTNSGCAELIRGNLRATRA